MNSFLLKNSDGVLGLAVINETRKIASVTYLSDTQNLNISFENGETADMETQIDQEFVTSLFGSKKIFVGHFPRDGFEKGPINEYHVHIDL